MPTWLPAQSPAVLQVGPGKSYQRIQDAVRAAPIGSTIQVFPSKPAYFGATLVVRKRLRFVAKGKVALSGAFNPVFRFEETASGSSISGFEIYASKAGIEVNGADKVVATDCDIHNNEIGVLSEGTAASVSLISCKLDHNGGSGVGNIDASGRSIQIDHCIVANPKDGSNLVSRCHTTFVLSSALYGGNGLQIKCLNGPETKAPDSNLMVYNCILAMDGNSTGAGSIVEFGAGWGKRNGRVHLIQTSIYTEFLPPILVLSSGSAYINACMVLDPDPMGPEMVGFGNGVSPEAASGGTNLFSAGYNLNASPLLKETAFFGPVQVANPAVSSVNSTGYQVEIPKAFWPETSAYVSESGVTQQLAIPPWKVGAEPGLFQKLTAH